MEDEADKTTSTGGGGERQAWNWYLTFLKTSVIIVGDENYDMLTICIFFAKQTKYFVYCLCKSCSVERVNTDGILNSGVILLLL